MIREFKAFILRGNVVDLAVAVILGASFGAIVDSLVKDLLMPPIGLLLGGVSFTDLYLSLDGADYPSLQAAQAAGAPTLNYGAFLQHLINFLILGLALFGLVRAANRLQGVRPGPEAPTTAACPFCRSEIALEASRCPHCTSELTGD